MKSSYLPVPVIKTREYHLVAVLVVNVGVLEESAFAPDNPCRWTAADVEAALGLGIAAIQTAHLGRVKT